MLALLPSKRADIQPESSAQKLQGPGFYDSYIDIDAYAKDPGYEISDN